MTFQQDDPHFSDCGCSACNAARREWAERKEELRKQLREQHTAQQKAPQRCPCNDPRCKARPR